MSKLSIIIPVYNMGKYIRSALESLRKQSFKDFVVIIVDDGSTDNSKEQIEDFLKESKMNIEYVYQENSGVSSARNKGLSRVETPYVYFLDADDILPEDALDIIMKYSDQYDIVAGKTSRLLDILAPQKYTEKEGVNYLLSEYLYKNSDYQFCNYLYKTSIIKDHNLGFSTDLKYGEDEEFAWKYMCYCKTALTTDAILYCYRTNPSSASNKVSFERVQVIDSIMRVCEYYEKNGHTFAAELRQTGVPHAKISILKQFAVAGEKQKFKALCKSPRYKCSMSSLLRYPQSGLVIASIVYILSPSLFYHLLNVNARSKGK